MSARPVPDDLAKMADRYNYTTLCKHYKCGDKQLRSWLHKIGWEGRPRSNRPMPADFPARAKEPTAALLNHYRCGTTTLTRWRRECGVATMASGAKRFAVPDDFAEVAGRGGTHRMLALHYGVSTGVIQRWKRETGVQTRPQRWRGPPATPASGRDVSVGGRAAEHLRIRGWVVYRCTVKGEPDRKGSHYVVGTRVRTEDEMLQMAERKGFVAFEHDPLPLPSQNTSTAVIQ